MASYQCNAHLEPAKVQQIITEFFAKSLHIILEARCTCDSSENCCSSGRSASSSTSSIKRRDKWFNLALQECPAALEKLDFWKQTDLDPLVVDVILVHRPPDPELACPSSGGCLLQNLSNSEKIVERWVMQYEPRTSGIVGKDSNVQRRRSSARGSSCELSTAFKKIYKSSISLLRSLYAITRLLPTYKLFRDLKSSRRKRLLKLTHKISSFIEPFSCSEDAEMNQFGFVPVDTPCGRLCLSVLYLPKVEDISLEPSSPLPTQLITDYVGSSLAEPVKRYESLPTDLSPSAFVYIDRLHVCNHDHRATSSISASPSCDLQNPHLLLQCKHTNTDSSPSMGSVSQNASLSYDSTACCDECVSSPSFSLSSPSPSTCFPSGSSGTLLSMETSPGRIVVAHGCGFPKQPLPLPKETRTKCSLNTDNLRYQVSAVPSPESKNLKQLESSKLGNLPTRTNLQKVFSLRKYGAEQKMPSCCSPQVLVSRIFGRWSLIGECDASGIVLPFAIVDDDIRTENSSGKEHVSKPLISGRSLSVCTSEEAAIGVIVRMLKTAPPLSQGSSESNKNLHDTKLRSDDEGIQPEKNVMSGAISPEAAGKTCISPSRRIRSRTIADALAELENYKEMDALLSKGV